MVEAPCSTSPAVKLVRAARLVPRQSTPLWSANRRSSIAMIANFMSGEISLLSTSTRCWSYNQAMGSPSASVTVEMDGRSPLIRSAEVPASESAILLDASPAAPARGNRDPAATTPAATQVATSFPSELIPDTRPEYVTGPSEPPLSGRSRDESLLLLCDWGNNIGERRTDRADWGSLPDT